MAKIKWSISWLAYCMATKKEPEHTPKNIIDFVKWMNDRRAEFAKKNKVPNDLSLNENPEWRSFLENIAKKGACHANKA